MPTAGSPRCRSRMISGACSNDRAGCAIVGMGPGSNRAAGRARRVIDTGVSPTASLAGRVEPGQSFVGGDATADENGHGTAVAGIIAGPTGVCRKCRILPLRVSAGASGVASSDNIAAAVDAAVGLGATVVNLSMIASNPTEVERAAFARATAAGVLVVAAAGNAASSIPSYPGSYPGVLSVGAAGDDGAIAEFSNRGSWVSVLAPACGRSNAPDGAQVLFCGTSASAPYVAGVAAVLRAAVPTATASDVIQAIRRSSHPVEGVADGLIDPAAALLAIGGAPPVVATRRDVGTREGGRSEAQARERRRSDQGDPLSHQIRPPREVIAPSSDRVGGDELRRAVDRPPRPRRAAPGSRASSGTARTHGGVRCRAGASRRAGGSRPRGARPPRCRRGRATSRRRP